jgi:hypothetical protein
MPGKVVRKRRSRPVNCWEFKECGRGLGGDRACPAATDKRADGVNRGTNGGRVCWAIAGTLCGGRQQGIYAVKLETCMRCDFYQFVIGEERVDPCDGYPSLAAKR